ncbi:ATP-binding cassette domain-containing protein, partial [Porphyromonas levii]|uniref:ATP-binding cassette domain-containing protein n=3 Tax=Porphyromonas levii TaxID=28114 RepID=UPI000375CD39
EAELKEMHRRNEVEGTFGTVKMRYGAARIRTRLPETTEVAVAMSFLAKNVITFLRELIRIILSLLFPSFFFSKITNRSPISCMRLNSSKNTSPNSASSIYSWQDVSISLDRMNEIHTEENEENSDRHVTSFAPDNLDIKVENLSFKYDLYSPIPILDNLNLTIPNGKVTAIVGASGSGKTTLIKLLLGYYSPLEGEIKVSGTNLEEYNLSWWRSHCGAVMQEGYLFSDTIARNIAISDDAPDIERIRAAARTANIAEHIESLPLAYNTMIGQDGQGISQGQRQRILIARMVYKDPTFVFLDEATNALDANNERAITEKLEDFYKGKTVVVVAHRLSTVRNADQIVVLDEGKIVEVGNHESLTVLRGKYYELVKNQLELGN